MKLSEINPGDLVLASLLGFPPWPSFVLSTEHIPGDMFDTRPHGKSVPVIFIGEPSYSWVKPASVKKLTARMCRDFLRKDEAELKLRPQWRGLKASYKIAAQNMGLSKYIETHFPNMLKELPPVYGPSNTQNHDIKNNSSNNNNYNIASSATGTTNNDTHDSINVNIKEQTPRSVKQPTENNNNYYNPPDSGGGDSDLEFVEEKEVERKEIIQERRMTLQRKAKYRDDDGDYDAILFETSIDIDNGVQIIDEENNALNKSSSKGIDIDSDKDVYIDDGYDDEVLFKSKSTLKRKGRGRPRKSPKTENKSYKKTKKQKRKEENMKALQNRLLEDQKLYFESLAAEESGDYDALSSLKPVISFTQLDACKDDEPFEIDNDDYENQNQDLGSKGDQSLTTSSNLTNIDGLYTYDLYRAHQNQNAAPGTVTVIPETLRESTSGLISEAVAMASTEIDVDITTATATAEAIVTARAATKAAGNVLPATFQGQAQGEENGSDSSPFEFLEEHEHYEEDLLKKKLGNDGEANKVNVDVTEAIESVNNVHDNFPSSSFELFEPGNKTEDSTSFVNGDVINSPLNEVREIEKTGNDFDEENIRAIEEIRKSGFTTINSDQKYTIAPNNLKLRNQRHSRRIKERYQSSIGSNHGSDGGLSNKNADFKSAVGNGSAHPAFSEYENGSIIDLDGPENYLDLSGPSEISSAFIAKQHFLTKDAPNGAALDDEASISGDDLTTSGTSSGATAASSSAGTKIPNENKSGGGIVSATDGDAVDPNFGLKVGEESHKDIMTSIIW